MNITQKDVDGIVARAKELGAGEGLTYKHGLWKLDGYEKPHTLEVLAMLLVGGWHGKYELIAAMQAALEFVESKLSTEEGK